MARLVIILVLAALLMAARAHAQVQQPINPTNCAACASLVIRGTGGVQQTTTGRSQISGISVSWTAAAARALMVFDAVALPANGAVTPAYCYVLSPTAGSATGSLALDWTVHPLQTLTGCVIAVSTNAAGCGGQLTLDTATNRIDVQAISP
jgi:hypothetical protein